jgi:hypothetical protein
MESQKEISLLLSLLSRCFGLPSQVAHPHSHRDGNFRGSSTFQTQKSCIYKTRHTFLGDKKKRSSFFSFNVRPRIHKFSKTRKSSLDL